MEYVLTEEGKRKVAVFIKECEAKRKEILDAGLDTAEDTQIPTEADILSDLNNGVEVDEDGDYYNAWGVTDNYCSDRACELAIGEDFVSNTTRVQVTLRKTIEVTEYFDATPEDLEMIERGENPFFGKMEDICNEQCGKRNSTTRSWTKIPGKHLSTGIKENEKRAEKFPSFFLRVCMDISRDDISFPFYSILMLTTSKFCP